MVQYPQITKFNRFHALFGPCHAGAPPAGRKREPPDLEGEQTLIDSLIMLSAACVIWFQT